MNKKINFWLFGISILLFGASLFLNISSLVITNESIVLVFVGILATFIVVGNFAQVSEIRESTENQIKDLDTKTQQKIDNLNTLFEKVNDATKKLTKIERDTYYATAESYRLFGLVTLDKKHFRNGTTHLVNAIIFYNKAQYKAEIINTMLDVIIDNLEPENWNHENSTEEADYDWLIKEVKNFPNHYKQKQTIIDLLKKHKNGGN